MDSVSSTRRGAALAVLFTALLASGCVSHQHIVGLGPTGSEERTERQYFILFGLIRANEVDTQRLADGLNSYQIETWYSFTDLLWAPILLVLTMTSRTVAVRT